MSNTRYSTTGFFDESFYKNAPLFASNEEPQNAENIILPEDSRSYNFNDNNAVPQSIFEMDHLIETNLEEFIKSNEVPQIDDRPEENLLTSTQVNADPHPGKVTVDLNLSEKQTTKSPVPNKKFRSQKRSALPKKIYFLPEEEKLLVERAEMQGLSFSNYIRFLIGFSLNEKGRKKQNTKAAFDLDDLLLDE